MRLKIYQINSQRDVNELKFRDLEHLYRFQKTRNVDASIYDQVFDADVETMCLEEIFDRFNHEKHPLYRGSSLSVSDVVVTEDGAFFCESFGFKEIEFDETKTQKPENLIRVLYVEPHRKPFVAEIENTLEGQQRAVKGLIQYLYNRDGTITVINDESKINGMEGNRRIEGDVLVGPFFVAGDATTDLCSLTDEQIEKYANKFAEPEDISRSEIEEHTVFTVLPWPMTM